MKVKMSNSNFIELSCEIADLVIKEKFGYGFRKNGSYATEEIQDYFNGWYDCIQDKLRIYIDEEL